MKRKIGILFIILMIMSVLVGCTEDNAGTGSSGLSSESVQTQGNAESGGKINVISTIFPGYDFVREIAGDNADVTMLLPFGAESHSFEPTPQDIIKIQNCDMFIYVGGDSDSWAKDILGSVDTSDMKIISMMDLVDVEEEEIVEGMEDDDDHGDIDNQSGVDTDTDQDTAGHEEAEAEYDEHVWTSPVNAIKIVSAISESICEEDKDNEEIYKENTERYVQKLEELDNDFREVVKVAKRDTIVFGDRFPFGYFAKEYGLKYFAAFPGCSTETEPSVKTVAFLIDKINEEKIPAVFHIEFSNERMADTIVESTGAEKLLFHSCHNLTKEEFEGGENYYDLMKRNVQALRKALS